MQPKTHRKRHAPASASRKKTRPCTLSIGTTESGTGTQRRRRQRTRSSPRQSFGSRTACARPPERSCLGPMERASERGASERADRADRADRARAHVKTHRWGGRRPRPPRLGVEQLRRRNRIEAERQDKPARTGRQEELERVSVVAERHGSHGWWWFPRLRTAARRPHSVSRLSSLVSLLSSMKTTWE